MRKLALAGAATLLWGAAALPSSAEAAVTFATTNLGTISSLPFESLVGGFATGAAGEEFSYTVTFTVTTPPGLPVGGATEIETTSPAVDLSFASFILNGPTGAVGSVSNTNPSSASINFANLADGNYSLVLLGTFVNAGRAGLGGTFTAEVPLPGAVLLFGSALAGLGMMRRRKSESVPSAA